MTLPSLEESMMINAYCRSKMKQRKWKIMWRICRIIRKQDMLSGWLYSDRMMFDRAMICYNSRELSTQYNDPRSLFVAKMEMPDDVEIRTYKTGTFTNGKS